MKEKGFAHIEQYCFEEHEHLRCAAVECLCNMVACEEVVTFYPIGMRDKKSKPRSLKISFVVQICNPHVAGKNSPMGKIIFISYLTIVMCLLRSLYTISY